MGNSNGGAPPGYFSRRRWHLAQVGICGRCGKRPEREPGKQCWECLNYTRQYTAGRKREPIKKTRVLAASPVRDDAGAQQRPVPRVRKKRRKGNDPSDGRARGRATRA